MTNDDHITSEDVTTVLLVVACIAFLVIMVVRLTG